MITSDGCIVMTSGEGRVAAGAAGAPTLLKATAEATGNLLEVFEQEAVPGSGPPLHIHCDCSESFFVLEGEFRFEIGSVSTGATTGAFVFVPKGVPHTYSNIGSTNGRLLFWFVPAARMAGYFEALTATGAALDDRTLDEIASRHGVEIVR